MGGEGFSRRAGRASPFRLTPRLGWQPRIVPLLDSVRGVQLFSCVLIPLISRR